MPREADTVEDFASGCWFSPGSCLFVNRPALLAVDIAQDESLRRFEDFDWFLALALKGLRLRTLPVVGAAVERRRRQSPAAVEAVAEAIIRKWQARLGDRRLNARIRAYMHLECAAANFFAGRRARAALFLLRSLAAKPRFSLHLSPGWELKPPG
jgi:GT2 family glycosyltransferase